MDYEKVNCMDEYPLTLNQEEIWAQQCIYPDEPLYNIGGYINIKGTIQYDLLKEAIQLLIKQNDALRLNIFEKDGFPFQKFMPEYEYDLKFYDFSNNQDSDQSCLEWMDHEYTKSFPLYNHFLFEFALLKLNNDLYYLFTKFHHIIMDGWGHMVVIKNLTDIYNSLMQQNRDSYNNSEDAAYYLSYVDLIQEDQKYFHSKSYQTDLEFWKEKFRDLPEPLIDKKTSHNLTKCSRKTLVVKRELYDQIVAYSMENNCTTFHFILGVLYLYFSRIYKKDKLVIGVPIHNRTKGKYKKTVGLFVNLIPLFLEIKEEIDFSEFLNSIQTELRNIYKYKRMPYGKILNALNKYNDRNDFIQISLSYEKNEYNMYFADSEIETIALSHKDYKIPLTIFVREFHENEDVKIDFDYQDGVFDDTISMDSILHHVDFILHQLMENPKIKLHDVNIIGELEQHTLIHNFNQNKKDYIQKTIYEMFEDEVEKTPNQTALVFHNSRLSYYELNQKANQLARTLRQKGVKPESIVAILLNRSIEMIISILAVMKAGGAYLPIMPQYPMDRINYMLKDSNASVIILSHAIEIPDDVRSAVIYADDKESYQVEDANLETKNQPNDLAYVIYTSGTTGKPKGVMIEHQSITNSIFWRKKEYNLTSKDHVLQLLSYSFDGFLTSFFTPIVSGATVILADDDEVKDPTALKEYINDFQITHFLSVPSLYTVLLYEMSDEDMKYLRMVTLAGEVVTKEVIKESKLKNNSLELVNEYGPTENSVVTTFQRNMRINTNTNIGKPISNVSVFILDKENRLQPIGVPGEICVSGLGIARGYLNNEKQTKETFLKNPFNPNERLYKTGDLGRWLADGTIEFLGRMDKQVKIRGYRIELSEIENCLLKYPFIKEGVVIDRENERGEKYLCAYYTSNNPVKINDLREYMIEQLPDYMIPTIFMQIEEIPTTLNGKLDKDKLPVTNQLTTGVEYEAPIGNFEENLASLWERILNNNDSLPIDKIGRKDNFFYLGGHSLKASMLLSMIRKHFMVEFTLKQIFENPILEDMANRIRMSKIEKLIDIKKVETEREYYPLTSTQKSMYVLNQLEGENTVYNMPGAMFIEGNIEKEKLEDVIKTIIQRQESLRTSFIMVENEPMQIIKKNVPFHINTNQIEDAFTNELTNKEIDILIDQFMKPFDLEKAPLLRVELNKIGTNKSLLLIDLHHIVSDGISTSVLFQEIEQLYAGDTLTELKLQYKDYAVWKNEEERKEKIKEQETYWLDVFKDEIPILELPYQYTRPAIQSYEGEKISFELDEELTQKLKMSAKSNRVTMYMLLLSAYNILLSKYSGQEDIVVGSPINLRDGEELQNMIGLFVNTLALRSFPKNEMTYQEFLLEVKEHVINALEHKDYPFENLVKELKIERNRSRNPLFDVAFTMENIGICKPKIKGTTFTPYDICHAPVKFDLTLNTEERDDKILCSIEYCTKLFDQYHIKGLISHYKKILSQICEDEHIKLSAIDLITDEEKKKIITEFNDTNVQYPKDKTICELFEEQVEKTPNSIAVVYKNESLTYRELNEKSNSLGRLLRENGVTSSSVVALMTERSLEMIIGIFGILKAGGAYVPIDPTYPKSRIEYMMNDSNAKLLITKRHLLPEVNFSGQVFLLEDKEIYEKGKGNLHKVTVPNDLAYMIYTSGTTGTPKGVMIEHQSMANAIMWRKEEYKLEEKDCVLQLFSYSFDGFITSFFTPIVSGAKVIFTDEEELKDTIALKNYMIHHKVTHLLIVPSLYSVLLHELSNEDMQYLEVITLAGETVLNELVKETKEKNSNIELVNEYGPTENTVVTTIQRNMNENTSTIIGNPIANTKVYILDKSRKLAPIGVPGEICISGIQVARGYRNREELTREKFIANPYEENRRMYCTGDLGKWLPDGKIEFLGRIDHQVKIRGYRIELEEIENYLVKMDGVKEAAVIAKEGNNNNKYLCAYIVTEKEIPISNLRESLSKILPDYMIPSYFMRLDSIPLTSNGKIDKKSLPEPNETIMTGMEYHPPRNEIEEKMVKVWCEVLGVDNIGIDHDFFTIGGDSIKAMQISASLSKYQIKVSVKQLFENSTIRQLGSKVQREEGKGNQQIIEGNVKLSPIQRWFFDKNFANSNHWNQSIMIFSVSGFEEEIIKTAFTKIITHHDALRLTFEKNEEEWIAYNQGIYDPLFDLTVINLCKNDLSENQIKAEIEKESTNLQKSIDLSKGPLVKLGLFKTKNGDHLLIAIHHLVVDGVSFRIILEDFATAYEQIKKNIEVVFPSKTDSYKDWSESLIPYSNSIELLNEINYWKKIEEMRADELVKDNLVIKTLEEESSSEGSIKCKHKDSNKERNKDSNEKIIINSNNICEKERCNTYQNSNVIRITLSKEDTKHILRDTNRAYHTEINDILLAALELTFHGIGMDTILVNLEGHGREEIDDKIIVTRTVGWFTSSYPIILSCDKPYNISNVIQSVKRMLRGIPNKGIGYHILKYITKKEVKNGLELVKTPQIGFNYFGQFDQEFNQELFTISPLSMGDSISKQSERLYDITINGKVIREELCFEFEYNKEEFKEETIDSIANDYKENLENIMIHCMYRIKKYREEIPNKKVLEGIEPFKDIFYKDCFYHALFPVIHYYQESRIPFLVNDIVLYDYDEMDMLGGLKAQCLDNRSLWDLLKERNLEIEVKNSEYFVDDICEAITSGKPVIVPVDCYLLPNRSEFYEKSHWKHKMLVFGYDYENRLFHVMEHENISSSDFKEMKIDFDDLEKSFHSFMSHYTHKDYDDGYLVIGKSKNQFRTKNDVHQYINSYLNHLHDKKDIITNNLVNLTTFKNDINQLLPVTSEDERVKYELDSNSVVTNIREIVHNLNEIIKYKNAESYKVTQVFSNASELTNLIQGICKDWNLIKANLERVIFAKKYDNHTLLFLNKKIDEVMEFEQSYKDLLLQLKLSDYTEMKS